MSRTGAGNPAAAEGHESKAKMAGQQPAPQLLLSER
jgi:hypothetical protein